MKKLLFLLAAVVMIFTACESSGIEEENGGPKIELSQQTIEVEFEPATYTVEVTSPYSWKAESDNEWIEVESKTGIAGTKELKFSLARNENVEVREGTITVFNSSNNLFAELYITQKAFEPQWSVNTKPLNFNAEGGEQLIEITANFEYEVSVSEDWVTYEKTDSGIKVTVPNYAEVQERTANITISNDKYRVSEVVKITQSAFEPKIDISPSEISFSAEGGEQLIEITANFKYAVRVSEDWVTYKKTDSGIKVTVPNYVTLQERTANVEIYHYNYRVSEVVKITQSAFKPEWSINVETLNFNAVGGERIIGITANFNGGYKATTDADWITLSYTNNRIVVKVAASNVLEQRTAEITISHKKYDLQPLKVNVVQEALDPNCIIFYRSYNDLPTDNAFFGANIVSNTYENGQGIIIFDAPVTSIGEGTFSGCSSLTSVTIPNSVTSIGYEAFYGCSSLTSVTIPNSVTSIGGSAFFNCSSLKYLRIGNSVTSIGEGTFSGCSSLTSVTIPNSVTSIGRDAFYLCSSLTSVTIPNSVTSIGRSAFAYCHSLTSVTIPDSVTSIGDWVFLDCSSLTSVTIGNSVTSIGYQAFYDCSSLKEVYCKPTTPPSGRGSMFSNNAPVRRIYVPTTSVSKYKSASYWSNYKDDIEGYNF